MRIVHVIRSDGFAGVERHVSHLARAQTAAGDQVVVVGGSQQRMRAALGTARIRQLPGDSVIQVLGSLRRVINGADIIHAHMTAAEFAAAAVRFPLTRRPAFVVTRHFGAPRGASRLGAMAARFIATQVQAQIAISEYVAVRIDGDSVVVHPGVNHQPLHTGPRDRTVLVVQRLEPEKDTDIALAGFAASGLAKAGWRLKIAGDGALRPQLEAQANTLGIAASVDFLGARTDIDELMMRSGMLLAPCSSEGLGLSVLEAMAAGLPVVAAASGGHLESLSTEALEFCFPPGDAGAAGHALAELAADAERRAELARQGRDRQQTMFSTASQAAATAEVYRRALGDHVEPVDATMASPNTRPRVAILDHTAQLGGAEIALARLLEALPDAFDVRVVLFGDGDLADELRRHGLRVEVIELAPDTARLGREELLRSPRRLGTVIGTTWRFTFQLASWLRQERVELVVANSLKSAVIAAPTALRIRRPWVWHLHDRLSSDYLPCPVVVMMRGLARFGPRRLVANSQATAALTGLRGHRLQVAYPGLPRKAFGSQRVPPEPPVIGILGRISATKGQREFLCAAAEVALRHRDVRFRVIGEALFNDQEYADQVRALPAQLGIAERVVFTGWVDDPLDELAGLTALVHASPVPEPFGQVIVEAMALGVPVIATASGGATEILLAEAAGVEVPPGQVIHTQLGQLIAPGDPIGMARAIDWVLDNPEQSRAVARTAAAEAKERFAIEQTADVVARVWMQVLKEDRDRRRAR